MLNKAILIGNIGNIRKGYTVHNEEYISITIATDSYSYRDGVKKHYVTWHNVLIVGESVSLFERLGIDKKDIIYVEGKLVYSKNKKSVHAGIRCDRFYLVKRHNNNKQDDDVIEAEEDVGDELEL